MRRFFRYSVRGFAATAFVVLASAAAPAEASAIASLQYVETDLGGGLFQYDYTLSNLSDPVLDAGNDIYDFGLFFSSSISLVNSFMPAGWQAIGGAGFVDASSMVPGPSPVGYDVAPGQSLPVVRLVFDGQIGSVSFEAVFSNPIEPENPLIYQGTTAAAVPAAVPEPASLLLVGSGLVSCVLARRRRAHSNHTRRDPVPSDARCP